MIVNAYRCDHCEKLFEDGAGDSICTGAMATFRRGDSFAHLDDSQFCCFGCLYNSIEEKLKEESK